MGHATLSWTHVIEITEGPEGYALDHFYVAASPDGGYVRSRGDGGDCSPNALARTTTTFPWDARAPFTPPTSRGGAHGVRLHQYLPYDEAMWTSLVATQRVAAGIASPPNPSLLDEQDGQRRF